MYRTQEEIRKIIGPQLHRFWSTDRQTYAGFSDEKFYLPTRPELDVWVRRAYERIRTKVPADPASYGKAFDCACAPPLPVSGVEEWLKLEKKRRAREFGVLG